jgi:signal peptidase I
MPQLSVAGYEFHALSSAILTDGHAVRFRARGGSMFPFIRDCDILEVRCVEVQKVRVGDVILYRTQAGRPIVHRVIKKIVDEKDRMAALITQGDAMMAADVPVHPDQILGCVTMVERERRRVNVAGGIRRILGIGWAWFPYSAHVSRLLRRIINVRGFVRSIVPRL